MVIDPPLGVRVPAADVVGGRDGRAVEDEAAPGLGEVGGVDDRFEQQCVAGNQAHPGPDEHRVVPLGLQAPPGLVGARVAEVDQAVVDLVAGGAQRGDVVVVGGAQRLFRQSGKLREVRRGVIDHLGVESDLDGCDGHGAPPR
ncbi:hypothetical protein [Mycobacterium sherrisii]|uniref:hypothetical protein n=1 Tax=Mycobacterium sherrisii TaxID=243061 RepID=UPI0018DB24DA|nr:hypothetical protein [Mycobacterium sherrisii]